MALMQWDTVGARFYESGVDRGVLYLKNAGGVPWNGLVSVDRTAAGAEVTPLYYDGVKYLDFIAGEDFQGAIQAFTYPDQFDLCLGAVAIAPGTMVTAQVRRPFDLCFRTKIGNDVTPDLGYKLHLIYNATVGPSSQSTSTLSSDSAPGTFSWNIQAVPVNTGFTHRPTAYLIVDSTEVTPSRLTSLENLLYGKNSPNQDPYMPDMGYVIDLLKLGTTPPYVPTWDPGAADPPYIVDGGTP